MPSATSNQNPSDFLARPVGKIELTRLFYELYEVVMVGAVSEILHEFTELDLTVDLSRLNVDDAFFAAGEPKIQKAFAYEVVLP